MFEGNQGNFGNSGGGFNNGPMGAGGGNNRRY